MRFNGRSDVMSINKQTDRSYIGHKTFGQTDIDDEETTSNFVV